MLFLRVCAYAKGEVYEIPFTFSITVGGDRIARGSAEGKPGAPLVTMEGAPALLRGGFLDKAIRVHFRICHELRWFFTNGRMWEALAAGSRKGSRLKGHIRVPGPQIFQGHLEIGHEHSIHPAIGLTRTEAESTIDFMDRRGGEVRPSRRNRDETIETKALSNGVLFLLVGLGLLGVFFLIRPFIAPMVLALFLVTIFHPFYTRLLLRLNMRKSIAAALSVAGIFLVVVIPFFLFTAAIVRQGIGVGQNIQSWVASGAPAELVDRFRSMDLENRPLLENVRLSIESALTRFLGEEGTLTDGLANLGKRMVQTLGGFILPLLSQTGLLLMNFFIMLFIMFYAFRDGDQMLAYFLRVLPLSSSHEKLLVMRVRHIVRAVLLGMLLTAALQAAAAMIGFKIIGVSALFWGVMLGISSFIPLVGTALVWVPITLYMLVLGKYISALFIFIWCAGGVGSIDNFLRPSLMQGKSGMSTLILFFALIGGIRLFGPIGILYGPLIFGLLTVMLYIYTLQHSRSLDRLDRS